MLVLDSSATSYLCQSKCRALQISNTCWCVLNAATITGRDIRTQTKRWWEGLHVLFVLVLGSVWNVPCLILLVLCLSVSLSLSLSLSPIHFTHSCWNQYKGLLHLHTPSSLTHVCSVGAIPPHPWIFSCLSVSFPETIPLDTSSGSFSSFIIFLSEILWCA